MMATIVSNDIKVIVSRHVESVVRCRIAARLKWGVYLNEKSNRWDVRRSR